MSPERKANSCLIRRSYARLVRIVFAAPLAVAALLAGCSAGHAVQTKHSSSPVRAPGGSAWKAVLRDWYDDGKFEQRHSCAAVRDAMRHLPSDGPIFSTAYRDLRRYARRVC